MIDRLVRFVNTISFHRGLSLGVLVGAAIAGSTLWSRLRGARDAERRPGSATEPTASVTEPAASD